MRLLDAPSTLSSPPHPLVKRGVLKSIERDSLHARAREISCRGHYLADLIRVEFAPESHSAQILAERARDRILSRAAPNPRHNEFGTAMVTDSYLVATLGVNDQKKCLTKCLAVARDHLEVATTRQDALTAARNLSLDQDEQTKTATFEAAMQFSLGTEDGSQLDEFTGPAHPLSSFKVNLGSASLRGPGLLLAAACAITEEQQKLVRDCAAEMLHSDEVSDVQASSMALVRLPATAVVGMDIDLLAMHAGVNVRQLAAVLCMRNPGGIRARHCASHATTITEFDSCWLGRRLWLPAHHAKRPSRHWYFFARTGASVSGRLHRK